MTALKCTHTELITNRMTFRFKHDHLSNQIVYCHWLLCIRPSTNHFELDKSPCGSNIHRLRYQLILGRSNGSQCDRRSTIRRRRLTTKKLNHHKIHEQSNRIEWNERTKQKKTVREKKPETRAGSRQRCTNGFVRCAAARLYVVEWLQAICTIFMIYLSAHVGNDRFPLKCVYDQKPI